MKGTTHTSGGPGDARPMERSPRRPASRWSQAALYGTAALMIGLGIASLLPRLLTPNAADGITGVVLPELYPTRGFGSKAVGAGAETILPRREVRDGVAARGAREHRARAGRPFQDQHQMGNRPTFVGANRAAEISGLYD